MTQVAFVDFWPTFDEEDFFMPLLRSVSPGVELCGPKSASHADVVVASVFHAREVRLRHALRKTRIPEPIRWWSSRMAWSVRRELRQGKKLIWYSGEALHSPRPFVDLSLGFEPKSTDPRKQYLPSWWLLFPELVTNREPSFDQRSRLGRRLRLDEVCRPAPCDWRNRPKFACAFISNMTKERARLIEMLRGLGQVDVFGAASGRFVESKWEISQDYRFSLALENCRFPGYVTEKLIEAWASGCVPIWNGMHYESCFDSRSFIHVDNYPSPDHLLRAISDIDRGHDLTPVGPDVALLTHLPDLANVKQAISHLLKSDEIYDLH